MDALIPLIYVNFLIVMGPALFMTGRLVWKIYKQDRQSFETDRTEPYFLELPRRTDRPAA